MMLMLVSLITSAQDVAKLNERYFQAKVRELVIRLEITDAQKTKFIPLYRQYSEEMRATVGQRQIPAGSLSDKERLALTKRRLERQQQAQTIRLRYIDKFSTILTAQQVSRFFDVESEIQKKLIQRRQQRSRKSR